MAFRYKLNQKVEFHGMTDEPELNGKSSTIIDRRLIDFCQYCKSGKAYCLKDYEGYFYEERLKLVE